MARVVGGLATVGMVATGAYLVWLRPRLRRWGASRDGARRPLPGDDLIPEAPYQTTRATAIGALPEQVWPWLVQMGYQRAGWYSYDRLEAMQGIGDFADRGSAQRIIPELLNLAVGDIMPMDLCGGLTVEVLEPNRALVLHRTMSVRNLSPVDLNQPDPGPYIDFIWAFVLESLGNGSTRLTIRARADYQPRLAGRILFPV
jgi:hypothetical protein